MLKYTLKSDIKTNQTSSFWPSFLAIFEIHTESNELHQMDMMGSVLIGMKK